MAKRFSKGALTAQLRNLEDNVNSERGFADGSGTAQLYPRGCDQATMSLIDRAVDYGRWRTLRDLACDLEWGSIGTA